VGASALIRLDDALAGITRLGIDTAPFIYLVERNQKRLPLVREVARRIDAGLVTGCGSVVTLAEVLVVPKRTDDMALERHYRRLLLRSRNFNLFPVDVRIADRAAALRARYQLRMADALVVSTAIQTGCQALLTNDGGLHRVAELRILVVDELSL